ncbi:lysM and putative peptidoglycan-binding domain-containing protein 1 [Homalodisca vitripennis]|uniref:lysM and putative peptidoglycan-binding domain-containing protein 1 n=1 Tax=Homalodisca vitripennis TaxID=197043 RepID=UPI001EEB01AC|nr:lysM and putative peptidoglycan-binding domain-containing protein 1 [Homalodisca vitripennis]
MEETICIRESAKSLKKYGSTNNHQKRQEHYIKHTISKSDTLQGIALKYGVTTEQIRRANRLWTSDSLFLRETLLVPVPSEGISSPSDVTLLTDALSPTSLSSNNNNNNRVDSDGSYNDFLCKIDCSIANTRSQVLLAQGNSEFQEEDTLFVRRKPMSRLRQQQSGELPLVMTQGRRVRNSLQRLEQQQDEMFEL